MTIFSDYKFANNFMFSDVEPYEITMFVSTQTLEIRKMDCEEIKWKKDFHSGGFFGHVSNQRDQKWHITSNENNPTIRIRKNKSGTKFCGKTRKWVDNFIWKDKYGNKYRLSTQPIKFYDYNF